MPNTIRITACADTLTADVTAPPIEEMSITPVSQLINRFKQIFCILFNRFRNGRVKRVGEVRYPYFKVSGITRNVVKKVADPIPYGRDDRHNKDRDQPRNQQI